MRYLTDKLLVRLAYFYIIFPFFLFCIGWLRWYYGLGMVAILVISFFLAVKNSEVRNSDAWKHRYSILLAVIIISVIVFFSGIGMFSYQVEDNYTRNVLFRDLVTHRWPYRLNETGNIPGLNGPVLYIYYIEYWLPAALIGKVFGFFAANVFFYLWTVAGMGLAYYFICRLLRRYSLWVLFVFLFFNSLYILVSVLKFPVYEVIIHDYLSWSLNGGGMLLAGSCLDSLFWIFNQTVVPWLIMAMMLGSKNSGKNIFFLYALCYLHGPFIFIGFFPFLFASILQQIKYSNLSIFETIKEYISFQNFIAAPLIVIISFFYLSGSYAVERLYFAPIKFTKFALYELLMFGIISVIIFKRYKRDANYYIMIGMFALLPLIAMGTIQPITFCARVSLVPQFILMIFVAKIIAESGVSLLKKVVIAYVVIGAVEPILDFGRSVVFTVGYYIKPVTMNTFLLNRTSKYQYMERVDMLPKNADLNKANFLILDGRTTQDTALPKGSPLIHLAKQRDETIFNKYLLKKN